MRDPRISERHSPRSSSSLLPGARAWIGVRRATTIATLLVVFLLAVPGEAAAYIDPISGSIILQVLAAAALGALLTIKRVWAALTGAGRKVWDGFTGLWRP